MKKQVQILRKNIFSTLILSVILFIGIQTKIVAENRIDTDTIGFNSYRGIIVESNSKKPLEFASLVVNGTNISTISNSKGEFLLKVPKKFRKNSVTVSFLGYTSQIVNLSDLNKGENTIQLETYIEELSEVKITVKDAPTLMKEVLKRKQQNYFTDYTVMTAFYRESIKKRRTYVSLSEAVVRIDKQPYTTDKKDVLLLLKSRKSTDYNKLDTITLKQRGGPFNTIYLDVMKNPELLFTDAIFKSYDFTFDTSTKIDNRVIYVVNFKQKPTIKQPLFYGKLYIDAQSLALISAKFKLNLSNKAKASAFFILKKPKKAKVIPVEASYFVDYRQKDGKWYHTYSRIQLGFKVDWNKKLFNSVYYSTMELAITDWQKVENLKSVKQKNRLKPSVVMSDEASGFSDAEFWGDFNVIEPEKPIEIAIKKIQKQLKKIKN